MHNLLLLQDFSFFLCCNCNENIYDVILQARAAHEEGHFAKTQLNDCANAGPTLQGKLPLGQASPAKAA